MLYIETRGAAMHSINWGTQISERNGDAQIALLYHSGGGRELKNLSQNEYICSIYNKKHEL